jgi:hypothetical protein
MTCHICTEDSIELAFKAFFSHEGTFLLLLKGNGERQWACEKARKYNFWFTQSLSNESVLEEGEQIFHIRAVRFCL